MEQELFIGIDIGGTNTRIALIDDSGRILLVRKVPTEIGLGTPQVSRRLAAECRSLMDAAAGFFGRVVAVGLGAAGRIDAARGMVVFSPNLPSMRDYPLAAELEKNLAIPVVLENDANVYGIGESWVGSGKDIENWIGLTLGTGVGGCLILGKRIWQGDGAGFAGEIGHMTIHPEGPACACGSKGCLETFSSGRALKEGVAAAIAAGTLREGPLYESWKNGSLTPETVYRAATEGNALAQALFDRMGRALGIALASLFNVLGIRHAIIGGGVSASWDRFIGPLRESLARHSGMFDPKEVSVVRSALGDDAALLGAGELARRAARESRRQ
ncbi:MAG: ROK family protein [Syntrophobacteraceae bacterium]|nr:ROK family protein [Desulfobacteraceae bacterium]